MNKLILLLLLAGLTPTVDVFAHEGGDYCEMNNEETEAEANLSEDDELLFPMEEEESQDEDFSE